MVKSVILILAAAAAVGFCQEPTKKITLDEALSAVTSKVQPEYSPTARQLKLEGKVELEATIDETGSVEKVDVRSGNPVLAKPATDALKKWKFKPFAESGKPVRVSAPFTFTFKL